MDVLEIMDEVASELSMAATYLGEGCWWNEGDDGIMDRAIEARVAVAELIEQNQRLTKAVRAFADGDMSDAMLKLLFSVSSDEPAKHAFAYLCTANDECEAALSRVRGSE